MADHRKQPATGTTQLHWVLLLTFIASLGTGVFWHGVSFIAKHTYAFDQTRNLVLYALMGALYVIGAFGAGDLTDRISRLLAPRGVMGWCIGVQAIVCVLPIVFVGEWALWFTAGTVSFLSAIVWPIVESYVAAGRHGPAMRSAIGWFNLIWMPAMVVPMLLMAPILERHGEWTIGGLAVTNFAALLTLVFFSSRPAEHGTADSIDHMTAEYPMLLRSARVLLPVSYVVMAALTPILPYRFEQVGIDVRWETPSAATWMVVRVVAVLLMWRLPFWHGRWGTLLLGAIAMTVGFATIVLGLNLATMIIGFAAFGVGLGIIYYTALYYGMAVGRAAVKAGGTHEALIGSGYAVGPLAGLFGSALGGGGHIVGVVWVMIGIAAIPALAPYVRCRKGRVRERVYD